MLFRSWYFKYGHQALHGGQMDSKASELVGVIWHQLTPGEQQEWQALAHRKKQEHKRLYPNWTYKPARKRAKKEDGSSRGSPENADDHHNDDISKDSGAEGSSGTSSSSHQMGNKKRTPPKRAPRKARARSHSAQENIVAYADLLLKSWGREGADSKKLQAARMENRRLRQARLDGRNSVVAQLEAKHRSRLAREGIVLDDEKSKPSQPEPLDVKNHSEKDAGTFDPLANTPKVLEMQTAPFLLTTDMFSSNGLAPSTGSLAASGEGDILEGMTWTEENVSPKSQGNNTFSTQQSLSFHTSFSAAGSECSVPQDAGAENQRPGFWEALMSSPSFNQSASTRNTSMESFSSAALPPASKTLAPSPSTYVPGMMDITSTPQMNRICPSPINPEDIVPPPSIPDDDTLSKLLFEIAQDEMRMSPCSIQNQQSSQNCTIQRHAAPLGAPCVDGMSVSSAGEAEHQKEPSVSACPSPSPSPAPDPSPSASPAGLPTAPNPFESQQKQGDASNFWVMLQRSAQTYAPLEPLSDCEATSFSSTPSIPAVASTLQVGQNATSSSSSHSSLSMSPMADVVVQPLAQLTQGNYSPVVPSSPSLSFTSAMSESLPSQQGSVDGTMASFSGPTMPNWASLLDPTDFSSPLDCKQVLGLTLGD